MSIVAPSHILSLWCRLGAFRSTVLDRLMWVDRKLFEHWTPIASIVLTEDYPLYHSLMREYPESLSDSWGTQRANARQFLAKHSELRTKLLRELAKGPLTLGEFEDQLRTKRIGGEWTPSSDVEEMLFHLHMQGEVMVVGHRGSQNLWDLSADFLPSWVDRTEWSDEEAEREAAQRAIRALGTATPSEVTYYFVRGRYRNLKKVLSGLVADATIHRVRVEELGGRDERYIHDRDLALLDSIGTDAWEPRMSLLPPFDNLLSSPARTKRMFGFEYVREQFLPAAKRRFGTYVLPILWGDRLIGRIDARLEKPAERLAIYAVYAEPGAPTERGVAVRLRETVGRLAEFLGARHTSYTSRVPPAWKITLH